MKKLFSVFPAIFVCIVIFGQTTLDSADLKKYYQQKSDKLLIGGWVAGGAALALFFTGAALDRGKDADLEASLGAGALIMGAIGLGAISVVQFIRSEKFRRKAASITLSQQLVLIPQHALSNGASHLNKQSQLAIIIRIKL